MSEVAIHSIFRPGPLNASLEILHVLSFLHQLASYRESVKDSDTWGMIGTI
jgi:hypothetical protein